MDTLFSSLGVPDGAVEFFAACTLKCSVLLVLAMAARQCLRRGTPASRHFILACAIGGVLALPVLALEIPRLAVPMFYAPSVAQPELTEVERQAPPTPPEPEITSNVVNRNAPLLPETTRAVALPVTAWRLPSAAIVLIPWGAVASVLLLQTAWGLFVIQRRTASAHLVHSEEWARLLEDARRELGIRRAVRLRQTETDDLPVTWGAIQPVILVPRSADTWTSERKSVVLRHELSHIRRWDYLTQLLARLACAFHWFNPLAWIVARALRGESEHACDDAVVAGGIAACDYAAHLLDIVHSLHSARVAGAAIAMGRPTRLETRVRAMLAKGCSRGPLSRHILVFCVLCTLFTVSMLAVIRPVARAEAPSSENTKWTAVMPSDAVVELVAVRTNNSEDKAFWRPDGAPLAEAPFEGQARSSVSSNFVYDFVFKASGLPKGFGLDFTFEGSNVFGAGSHSGFTVATVGFTEKAETQNILIKVPSEKWTTVAGAGRDLCGTEAKEGFVAFSAIHQNDGCYVRTVTIAGDLNQKALRLIALMSSGDLVVAPNCDGTNSPGLNVYQNTYEFTDLKLDDVKLFQLQACDWDTVEFHNVSLVPGQHTNCEIVLRKAGGHSRAAMGGMLSNAESENARLRQQCATNLKQLGVMCKKYDGDHRDWLPALDPQLGRLMFKPDEVYPKYLSDPNILHCPVSGQITSTDPKVLIDDESYFYLGFVTTNEEEGMAFIAAYREAVKQGIPLDGDLNVPPGIPGPSMIYRLKEGIERYNSLAEAVKSQSMTPVIIEPKNAS